MIEGTDRIDIAKIKESGWSYEDLYNHIFNVNDPVENYKLIVGEYSGKVDDVMSALGEEFIKWIAKNKSSHSKFIPSIIVMVAQHQAQRVQVIDPVVSLLSLVFQIQKTINS